jgi:hypothetical protein
VYFRNRTTQRGRDVMSFVQIMSLERYIVLEYYHTNCLFFYYCRFRAEVVMMSSTILLLKVKDKVIPLTRREGP